MPRTVETPIGRTQATRFPELSYQEQFGDWRIVDNSTGNSIGPQYKSKTELLTDLNRFAREFGCTADPTLGLTRTFQRWTRIGTRNFAVYPPGATCEAMNGSPVNENCWTLVVWWPGTTTWMTCCATDRDAARIIDDFCDGKL